MKLNLRNIIENVKIKFHSIRIKLFVTLSLTVAIIVTFLILINSFVLETYYIYSKGAMLLTAYEAINNYYNETYSNRNIELELYKMSLSNDFDILIRSDSYIYVSDKDFLSSLQNLEYGKRNGIDENMLHTSSNVRIIKTVDKQTQLSFILLSGKLDNDYELYIRVAIAPIQANARISNRFFMLMGIITTIIGGIVVSIISKKFTSPIEELNKITSKISELDFSYKYDVNQTEDEFNNLRKKYKYNVKHFRKNNKAT